MKLKELLHGLDVLELHADEALDITGVQYDSRQVTPGALFVAISGFQTDGHKYIPKAMENGAVCVVCEKKPETDIPYVLVSNARSALAALGHSVLLVDADPQGSSMDWAGARDVRRRNHRHERQNDQHVSAEARA